MLCYLKQCNNQKNGKLFWISFRVPQTKWKKIGDISEGLSMCDFKMDVITIFDIDLLGLDNCQTYLPLDCFMF